MENITDKTLLEEWNSILLHQLLFNTVILWVYCAVGIVGNTVVLFFYSFRIKGKLEDRFLIPHLAFFDLLATIFTTIDKTLDNIFPVMYPNHRLCQISNFTSRVFAPLEMGFCCSSLFRGITGFVDLSKSSGHCLTTGCA